MSPALSVVVYRSRAVLPPTDIDLFYLLAQARRRNQANDLTGLLLYDRGSFFQWLEGRDKALGEVWTSIRKDPRHAEIAVYADQSIPVRLFAEWHMHFAHRDRQHERIIDGFSVVDQALLDGLHDDPESTPRVLASLSSLGPQNWVATI